jgi:hypothetical protein
MKLSNFELTKTKGKNALDLEYFAEVDVTTETGILWWKKSETIRREIRREFCGKWHFTSDGKFTHGIQAEELARAWKSRTGQDV